MNKIQVVDLKCNYLTNPLGVDTQTPVLGWKTETDKPGFIQTGYRILVASDQKLLENDEGSLWDTGKVESDIQTCISYKGKELVSRQTCYWKVKIWGNDGIESPWSKVAKWEMGLLNEDDWKARWITDSRRGGFPKDEGLYSPLYRNKFILTQKPVKARAYISGLGYYELYINGNKSGDEVLAPGFTRYDESVLYQVHDITEHLSEGCNVAGVILGDGWYNCSTSEVWSFKHAPWRDKPKLICQIHIDFEDGSKQVITSGPEWVTRRGPITFNALRNGEYYDARLEIPGWNMPDHDDSAWQKAIVTRPPGGILRSQQMTPIRVVSTIKPVSVNKTGENTYIFDGGQILSGWGRIRVKGPAGTVITIRYGECLDEKGELNLKMIEKFVESGEFQTDRYTLKGEGLEEWEPRFTYHGFRYVQVSGYPGAPDLDCLDIRVVHTDLENRGGFECSDSVINAIQHCARWSTLTNYHGIPTDCPQREKNGWTGDALLSAEQIHMNFDPQSAYTKWLLDFKDVQRHSGQLPGIIPTGAWGFNWGSGPAWDSAIILIPWYMYLYDGNTIIFNIMYENMKRYMDYMAGMATDYLVDYGLPDWCPPEESKVRLCPSLLTDTAYYFVNATVMAKIASILGKEDDEAEFTNLAHNIRNAFRRQYFKFRDGKPVGLTIKPTQTSLSCVLYQGLADEDEMPVFEDLLAKEVEKRGYHIDCGILGAKYVMHALTKAGRSDLAHKMAVNPEYPGWGNLIARGATTLWENWMGSTSLNHHMFSDISSWFYKALAGINPDPELPGFKRIILTPDVIPGISWVKAWHMSQYGRISSEWKFDGNKFIWDVEIPPNCDALLRLPDTGKRSNGDVVISYLSEGKLIQMTEKTENDCGYYRLGSGKWKLIM